MNRRDYKISIVGSGSVGKAIGKVLAKYGYQVIFCDVDRERLEELASQGYQVSEKPAEVDADISFICVPTPNKDGRFDGSYVKAALSRLRDISSSRAGIHAIIIKSTVLPEILEQINGHGVCLNPEFLRSEMPEEDFENQPVVIGCIDPKATEVLKEFYQDFKKRAKKDVEVLVTDAKTAAMIKYASNCLLATKISFFNEIAEVCTRLGVDPRVVVENVITDRYPTIEFYRRDFLSLGFQDECLPKDLEAFISFCGDLGYEPELLKSVRNVNERIKAR